jgi:MerR family transcriptional regulator/heat shock protein HspR
MSDTIIPRERAANKLSVTTRALLRYESLGLVQTIREGEVEGYGPSEIRRLWTIVSLHRDLGVNLAGVEAVLKLRDHIGALERRITSTRLELIHFLESECVDDD